METIIERVEPFEPDENVLKKAAGILRKGGLVAFPTETVYGLGGNGLDSYVCKKIYEAKGRPSDNPLILHVSRIDQINHIVRDIPKNAYNVMKTFWPGPITLVMPKKNCVPIEVTGGLDTVAVRFPSNVIAQSLISMAGFPIAAPSANSSGKPSPTRASHVEFDLYGKIDMIIDGGPSKVGLESTILDVTNKIPIILRPGAISREMLEKVVGKVEVDSAVTGKPDSNSVPKAPGMKYVHYSPKADITLVKGDLNKVAEKINNLVENDIKNGIKPGIIATVQTKDFYSMGTVLVVGDRNREETIGSNLFKVLRKFDFLEIDKVYSEVFDETGEGAAIMNRLNKAAGYKCIDV